MTCHTRHLVVEERPLGRHRERPDIRALGRSGGTGLFVVTICHPLSQARIRDVIENPMNLLKAAWTLKVSRYAGMLQAGGTGFKLLPVPLSTLGGWHPGAHKALCSVASTIAARGLSTFSRARSILFQRHAALLVTNNALCLMSGPTSDIWGNARVQRSMQQWISIAFLFIISINHLVILRENASRTKSVCRFRTTLGPVRHSPQTKSRVPTCVKLFRKTKRTDMTKGTKRQQPVLRCTADAVILDGAG